MSSHLVITGKTKVVGILGYPVEHSLSPPMHNSEFERLGLDYVYVPIPVVPGDLETCVRGLAASGLGGFNITIPHKQAVLPFLDEVSEQARMAGAVNTVRIVDGRLAGFNTDIPGWVQDIQEDILLEKASVGILGAGGVARAVAVGALSSGVKSLAILARRPEASASLATDMRRLFPDTPVTEHGLTDADAEACSSCEILVNCTPAGMDSSPGMPVPSDWLSTHQYVYDTIYTPARTALLEEAGAKGCAVRNGLGMLARQGAEAFEIWTGVQPDVGRMKGVLLDLLEEETRA